MSEQAKHTPGPWAVEPSRFCDRVHPTSDDSICIAQTGNWLEHEKGEQHANARLIAAAPDLAQSLDRLLTVIRMAGLSNLASGVQLGQTSWFVKASDAMDAAEAAIAKALGQGDAS